MCIRDRYDEIQTQIESEVSDFTSASDRVQTEDDLCNIECKDVYKRQALYIFPDIWKLMIINSKPKCRPKYCIGKNYKLRF